MRIFASLSLVAFTTSAASSILPVNERCVTAVSTAYTYITFTGSVSRKYLETRCQNPLEVISIYASSDVFCEPPERSTGLSQLETICRESGFDLIPRERLAENLTDDAIRRMRVVDYLEFPMNQPLDFPVLLSQKHYNRVFRTLDAWAYESWTHYAYGYAGYLYWACILLIGMLNRMLQHFLYLKYDQLSLRTRSRYLPFQRIYHWIQTHFLVSTAMPSRGRQFLWWTFSTRIEAIVTLGFWVLSTVLCSVSYRIFPENIYWPETSTQLIRYMADRTGIVSFANLPLVWLFAGRNNICAWATGWNFATFNIFHRHVAWIATIQAAVHTALYLVLFFQNSNPWRKLRKQYILWGTLGMVLMVLILPAAVNWFRHRAYETFLFLHIVFSVGVLIGCFYHTIIFEGQVYWFYLWLPVGIWVFDRSLRIARTIYCNLHVRRRSSKSRIQYTSSTATYDKAANLIRLEILPGSSSLDPRPGQYYFLYQPFRLTGWESHPFTLGDWSYELGRTASSSSSSSPSSSPTATTKLTDESVDVSQIPLLSSNSSSSLSGSRSRGMQLLSGGARELKLVFWIRPYDGWTRHLQQRCLLQSPENLNTTNVTILLEGPYGHEFPLWRFESVLLIAGGTGIASAVPYIHDHIARSSTATDQDENENEAMTSIRDVQLIWVTRQQAFIQQVTSRELKPALDRGDFHASFYATSPRPDPSPSQSREEYDIQTTTTRDKDTVEINEGRPNLEKLISVFAEEAHNSASSAAVLVCGPPRMADEARAAVYLALRQGYALRYVEESFSW
ncbi:ferric reductase like transmembrane component-domain-containing protein [Aspergillus cavernicola]|uniref:Ferric reductase like transmembrane component-domain-containing protein n=1 Tax=Aspergillus cavernicola TaxID=176166 RepID=A0ABR4HZV8_9EURO